MGNLAIDFNHKATLASSNMPTSVESLNFNKLKFKLTSGKEATMSKKVCEFAEQEYKRFLALKYFYPKETLVPNKLVDEFWHAHILDTRNYHMDCLKIFGAYLHHYPYFGIHDEVDQQNLKDTFQRTKELYEVWFGPYPDFTIEARCGDDHACHAPSSCACRVPGACK
ncbi:hypothetical protein Q8G42_00855 [Acinetobacter lwoffii]|jgi:hypothetical protein|uniref:Glycine-rich domain-containing protein-like n=1 Tax=Acinetobacter lwoffii TaxID=28090 RepID=A0AAW8ARW7_ACILW|nr:MULTISPECIES: hypothetical protein [Acinetobacter]ODN53771.1 hypothetical protein A9Z54_13015 [Acinetobacter sp. 51m]EEY91321.1 hypothetical protein HMPREF0017_00334 [Acinetobacter lwoffii SH145]ENW26796.1 hypothetical protein F924_02611 [Acinetobacter lwoffii ATCC 9957 = CIP 70.31]ENX27710.1 hypothetical protein F890_03204 [Acinetobacter sp. CIP 64.7]MCU4439282.1 hypothetical protein [Acinetobacter lwoffii]